MSAIDDFKLFVADAETGTQYAKWAQQNPNELYRWTAFKNAILNGDTPPAPSMTTAHGRELVDAAVQTEHFRAVEQQPTPAPVPDPTPAPTPTPAPSTSFPKQGLNIGFSTLAASSARQDQVVAACKDLANGKPCVIRIDWWPGDGRYDTLAGKCSAAGLDVLPLWNQDYSSSVSQASYASSAAQIAAKSKFLNLFNEPDRSGWPPAVLADYMIAAYAAAKAANPAVFVVGPSIDKQTGHPADTVAYLQAMQTHAAGAKMVDGLACHFYDDATQNDPSWNLWSVYSQIKAIFPGVPIISTEAGAQASRTYIVNGQSVSGEEYQRRSVANGMDARTTLGLASYIVYAVPDDASPGGYGLKRPDWSSRPAYAEFKGRAV